MSGKVYQYEYKLTGDSYSLDDLGHIEAASFAEAAKISQEIVDSIPARAELLVVRLIDVPGRTSERKASA